MVIFAHEEIWRHTFSRSFSNMNRSLLCLRYVDNRLWIPEDRFATLPGVRLFLSNHHVYAGNIVLEDEPAFDFVGFSLDVPERVIRYNRTCQAKDLPIHLSACPEATLVSGIIAGAHTIKKCAFPSVQVQADLRYLWNLAVSFRCKSLPCFQKFWNK